MYNAIKILEKENKSELVPLLTSLLLITVTEHVLNELKRSPNHCYICLDAAMSYIIGITNLTLQS